MSKRILRFVKLQTKNKIGRTSSKSLKPVFILPENTVVEQPKMLSCPICFMEISNKGSNLTRHIKLHNKTQKVYKCIKCDRKYQNESNFNIHKKTHHNGEDPETILYEMVEVNAKGIYLLYINR